MPPAPVPRFTNTSNCNFILPAFNDRTFSDLTVLSGPTKAPFHIHRVIVSATSHFFKAHCTSGNYAGSSSQIIELPNITPAVLQVILLWQYGQQYALPPHSPPSSSAQEAKSVNTIGGNDSTSSIESLIITTYSAATYLQIPLLQSSILAVIADEFRFRPWIRFTRPVDFMDALCNQRCLHINHGQPITTTTTSATCIASRSSSSTSVFPTADYSGNVNFVHTAAADNKVAIIECISVMVASHNFKDLANEIDTLKGEKLKGKKEEEMSGTKVSDDHDDDAFFTVILPIWEDYVRKKEQRRVLDPPNDHRLFKPPKPPRASRTIHRLIDLSVLLGFLWLTYYYREISLPILGWLFMVFGMACFFILTGSLYRFHRHRLPSW
ncbi:hypothetical protein TWF281_000307 [Arthrobotrys megalospora]